MSKDRDAREGIDFIKRNFVSKTELAVQTIDSQTKMSIQRAVFEEKLIERLRSLEEICGVKWVYIPSSWGYQPAEKVESPKGKK